MKDVDRQQRLAVARAVDDLYAGRLSRRAFLRVCAAAGFFLPGLMSGCRPRSQPVASAADESHLTAEQEKFLKEAGRTLGGRRVRIVTEDTPPSQVTRELVKDEFTRLSRIEVEWEQLPLDRVLAKIAADTARAAGTHDIFYLDQAWIGRFADDTEDPETWLAKTNLAYPGYDFQDILQPLREHVASYEGKLSAIPYDIPIYITMYRADLFRQLGLTPPKTVPEYLETARRINKELAPRTYGTSGQWKAGHYSLECDMTMWLWAHGGSIFDKAGKPVINDERGEAALNYMMELRQYMSPAATTWEWHAQAADFAAGNAGFYTAWGEFFPIYDDPKRSRIVGKAEAVACPQPLALRSKTECGFGETPGVSHQGGSSLAISRYSKNKEAAWVFLQWATSPDVTTRACILGGGASPIRRSNYDDPRVKQMAKVAAGTTRHFDVTLDAILHHMGTEPHLPAWAHLSVDSFAVELGKLTTGQQDVKSTLKNMAEAAEKAVAQNKP
jgi:multiple sugar transport system substrate-binding protein